MERVVLVLSVLTASVFASPCCGPPHGAPHLHFHPRPPPVVVETPSCGCNDGWRSWGPGGLGSPGCGGGGLRPGTFGGSFASDCLIVQPVSTPGRIIVQEAPSVVAEYVESAPLVLQLEAAPRFVFGDTTPVRISHHSRPSVIEHFETPYVIDTLQRLSFINHAAQPVVIDHYEQPEVVKDEGLPIIYEACDCGASSCSGGCGCSVPATCGDCGASSCSGGCGGCGCGC